MKRFAWILVMLSGIGLLYLAFSTLGTQPLYSLGGGWLIGFSIVRIIQGDA